MYLCDRIVRYRLALLVACGPDTVWDVENPVEAIRNSVLLLCLSRKV